MAKYNILQEKSFAFAVRIVKLYKFGASFCNLCQHKLIKKRPSYA